MNHVYIIVYLILFCFTFIFYVTWNDFRHLCEHDGTNEAKTLETWLIKLAFWQRLTKINWKRSL